MNGPLYFVRVIARTSFKHHLAAERRHGPLIVAAQPRAGLRGLCGDGGFLRLLSQGLQPGGGGGGGLCGPNFVVDDVAVAVLLLQQQLDESG